MKGVPYLFTVAIQALATTLVSAYDPSPLQDFCVAINNTDSAGMYMLPLFFLLIIIIFFFLTNCKSTCPLIISRTQQCHNHLRSFEIICMKFNTLMKLLSSPTLYHLHQIFFFAYKTCYCPLLQNFLICDNNKLFFVQYL